MNWSHGKLEIRCQSSTQKLYNTPVAFVSVPFSKERLEYVMEEHERVLEALQTSNVPSSKVPPGNESRTPGSPSNTFESMIFMIFLSGVIWPSVPWRVTLVDPTNSRC